jgi:hypothetical protein
VPQQLPALLSRLGRLITGRDSAVTVTDADDAWHVQVTAPDVFQSIDADAVPIDEDRGVWATMGTTKAGSLDVSQLIFRKDKGWTQATVKSFLADNGFDSSRGRAAWRSGSERLPQIQADKARIKEERDWWVIQDNVVARDGAFNGILRPAPIFDKSWMLYEGIPITHPHPTGIVEDLSLVGGIVENVRLDRRDGHAVVMADYRLARRTGISGLAVPQAMVGRNEETVKRIRSGTGVDNSQGYLWKGRSRGKGDPDPASVGGDYDLVMEEHVPNHLAILLDEKGACAWEAGCGVARLALEAARIRGEAFKSMRDGAPSARKPPMCDGNCPQKLLADRADKDAKDARDALQTERDGARSFKQEVQAVLDSLGVKTVAELRDLKPRLDALKASEEKARREHSTVARETAELAAKLGKKGDVAELTKEYEATPLHILKEHKSGLDTMVKLASRHDATRPGATGRDAQGEGVSLLNTDGSLKIDKWQRKPASTKEE